MNINPSEYEILLVEDEVLTYKRVIKYMSKLGFRILHRPNGREALSLVKKRQDSLDLLLLDVGLPGINGLELCKQLRRMKVQIPILILSNKGDTDTIVSALDNGADDYISKPFELSELFARAKSMLRRPAFFAPNKITAGKIKLDLDQKEAFVNNKKLNIRKQEFALLQFLVRNQDQPLSREHILQNVWHPTEEPSLNTVDVHIRSIRRTFEKLGISCPIETMHGFGYKLNS
jgi:DNA-binding response OmpR family regulator